MGSWWSSDDKEANSGTANNANSITINEKIEMHNDLMFYTLLAILILQLIKFLYHVYSRHHYAMKKKYSSQYPLQTVSTSA